MDDSILKDNSSIFFPILFALKILHMLSFSTWKTSNSSWMFNLWHCFSIYLALATFEVRVRLCGKNDESAEFNYLIMNKLDFFGGNVTELFLILEWRQFSLPCNALFRRFTLTRKKLYFWKIWLAETSFYDDSILRVIKCFYRILGMDIWFWTWSALSFTGMDAVLWSEFGLLVLMILGKDQFGAFMLPLGSWLLGAMRTPFLLHTK